MLYLVHKGGLEMKRDDILEQLDNYAEDYNFPILDNYNYDLAKCRLSVFRDDTRWIITIETIGYGTEGFDNSLYAYGNCIDQRGLVCAFDDIISFPNSKEIDEKGKFNINYNNINVKIGGEELHLRPTAEEYIKAKIDYNNLNPTNFIRFIASYYSNYMWLSDSIILSTLRVNNSIPLFYRAYEWNHPIEESPSQFGNWN